MKYILNYSIVIDKKDSKRFERFLKEEFKPFLEFIVGCKYGKIFKLKSKEESEESETIILQFPFPTKEALHFFNSEWSEAIFQFISAKALINYYYFDSVLELIE